MNDERISTIYVSAIAFPLVFIIIGVFLSFNAARNFTVLKNTVTVEATVVSVKEDGYWDTENAYHDIYCTKVNYEYEGQEYHNIDIGTLNSKHKIGELLTIRVDKNDPSSTYTTKVLDVFFPVLGALVFGLFGCLILFALVKWYIQDAKQRKSKSVILAFKLPTKVETIVGLVLAALVALFILLQIYVLSGMIVGAVIFGFFFLMWVDCCLLK